MFSGRINPGSGRDASRQEGWPDEQPRKPMPGSSRPREGEQQQQKKAAEPVTTAPQPDIEAQDESDENASDEEVILDYGKPWRKGPTPTELTFLIPTDKVGGTEERSIEGSFDFSNSKDVKRANKLRSQTIRRAKQKIWGPDYPRARPSVEDRRYTDEHNAYIKKLYRDYARANNGKRMPPGQLAVRFNDYFDEEEPRSDASLASHVDRRQELKDVKMSYSS